VDRNQETQRVYSVTAQSNQVEFENELEPAILDEIHRQRTERFFDFPEKHTPKTLQSVFAALKELGFQETPQEPCIVIRKGIICFFFVDDIVLAYRKEMKGEAENMAEQLGRRFTIKRIGELSWFLGIHVIRDRKRRLLWLSQRSYIEKVASQFPNTFERADTPITERELLPPPADLKVTRERQREYQAKIGSVLFIAISTRPDIAFAVARLSRFNQRAGEEHHQAVDRLIRYLY